MQQKLTRNEFDRLCSEVQVHPAIALENAEVVKAIRSGDAEKVKEALRAEF